MKKVFLNLFIILIFVTSCFTTKKIDESTTKVNHIYSAIWCEACNEKIDEIVAKKQVNTVIVFYPYDQDGRYIKEEILRYVKDKKIKNKVIIDEKLKVLNEKNIETVPFEY